MYDTAQTGTRLYAAAVCETSVDDIYIRPANNTLLPTLGAIEDITRNLVEKRRLVVLFDAFRCPTGGCAVLSQA